MDRSSISKLWKKYLIIILGTLSISIIIFLVIMKCDKINEWYKLKKYDYGEYITKVELSEYFSTNKQYNAIPSIVNEIDNNKMEYIYEVTPSVDKFDLDNSKDMNGVIKFEKNTEIKLTPIIYYLYKFGPKARNAMSKLNKSEKIIEIEEILVSLWNDESVKVTLWDKNVKK